MTDTPRGSAAQAVAADPTAASAFAAAVCRWHHAHNGQPVPCVQADREAAALAGLLEHAGYQLTANA